MSRITRNHWFQRLAIVLGIAIAYSPVVQCSFIWDDNAEVTKPALRSLSGLWSIWFHIGSTQQYYPLLHTWFWMQWHLWGGAPLGYHIVGVTLHSIVACLVLDVLRELEIPGAFLAAAVFAVHPVHVDSVAWVAEQKNTLSGVFCVASLLLYLRFDKSSRRSLCGWALAMFLLALLSKTSVTILPAAILVLLWWKRGSLDRRDVLRLTPFFLAGAVAGTITSWVEKNLVGANGAQFAIPFTERILVAGRVPWFYLGKLILPKQLLFIYPKWELNPSSWIQWAVVIATSGVTVALWIIRGKSRAPLAAWLIFLGALFPVSGFFNVYYFTYSFVADHFQYLASIAAISSITAAISLASRKFSPRIFTPFAGVVVVLLGAGTWAHIHDYSDLETVFTSTLRGNPHCALAMVEIGNIRNRQNRTDEATALYEQAIKERPDLAIAHYNMALMLMKTGRSFAALAHLREAVSLRPDYAQAHNGLANLLLQRGQSEEAIEHYRIALRYSPDDPDANANLGAALLKSGKAAEAIVHFNAALAHGPDLATYANMAQAYMEERQPAQAIATARTALAYARATGNTRAVAQIEAWIEAKSTDAHK